MIGSDVTEQVQTACEGISELGRAWIGLPHGL